MNRQLRNSVASAFLLLPAAAALVAMPAGVAAQPAAPEIRSLQVTADGGLEAGSSVTFTVIGTPRAEGSVSVRGLRDSIPLTETERGVYIGRYTIRRSDRVDVNAEVRAELRYGNRTSVASYLLADAMPRQRYAPAPLPVVRGPDVRIERFGMAPLERIEPGAELQFSLDGMYGAQVTVDLPGVDRNVPLRETRPGHYEGQYTLRRGDNLNANRPLVATLRSGDRVVTANLGLALGRPLPPTAPPVVLGPARPAVGVPVPFQPQRPPAVVVVPGPTSLAVQVLNHLPNEAIGPDPTLIRGRTAPGALVAVNVRAFAPPDVAMEPVRIVYSQTLQADGEGIFSFVMVPGIPVPGVRYEIMMVASRGNVSQESRFSLVQQ